MVGTVTLNPCIDRTCCIEGFVYGGMNRIKEDRRDVSGKGINVSLALKGMGRDNKCSGFLYREGEKDFLSSLEKSGIKYESILVEGRVRENIKLWNSSDSVTSEINQKGFPVSSDKVEEFITFYSSWVSSLSTVVLTGSVPEGVDKSIYRDLGIIAKEKGVRVILDAEGELLLKGLEANPFLIKPNRFEFLSAFAPDKDDVASIAEKARELIEKEVAEIIVVTLGEEGALLVEKDHIWRSFPPKMEVKSTQGAGDSVVAGLCVAMDLGLSCQDMLRYGMAAASATVSKAGTEMCNKKEVDEILPMIKVEEYFIGD